MKANHTILTITGSDSTGLSGIQADITTITSLGGQAVSVITSITAQNTLGIQQFYDIPASVVRQQIEAIVNDVQPRIVKIGLIRSVEVLNVIVEMLTRYRPEYTIYDPVVVSAHGERLLSDDIIAQIKHRLIPLCSLVIDWHSTRHGQNNTYASALAYYLAEGRPTDESSLLAQAYIDRLPGNHQLQSRSAELYEDFLRRVEEHYQTNSDVAFYADSMNVTARYLAQVCRQMGRQSPKQIIDDHLLSEARRQLATTSRTIQETAYHCGFSSPSHFTKFFKKLTGMSPSEYRAGLSRDE